MTDIVPGDAFGDSFSLDRLALPRPAVAYGIQRLGTDLLLDRQSDTFKPIRTPDLQPRFNDFSDAFAAASAWLITNGIEIDEHDLSIIPLAYDPLLERHVLIFGVLCGRP